MGRSPEIILLQLTASVPVCDRILQTQNMWMFLQLSSNVLGLEKEACIMMLLLTPQE